jgi:SAM-dependent methyltransferase
MMQVGGEIDWTSIEELFERTFGVRSAADRFPLLRRTENERPEVKEFVARAFRLMAISKMALENITPRLDWILGVMIPGLLPGAWGNVVPPFTYVDRHLLINQYLAAHPWGTFADGSVLLEMGCGFPPQTAVDAAREFPGWQVIGADVCFDRYVLYDSDGTYACIDSAGGIRYCQPGPFSRTTFLSLYGDREAALRRFHDLFAVLREKLPFPSDGRCTTVEHDGARLVGNPIRSYEGKNLTLLQAGVGEDVPPADIIRVFNVLFYFDAAFRSRAEQWALRTLRPGGLFLCGADNAKTLEARYSVYRKEHDTLVRKEFAFSLDCIRPPAVIPFFCLHDQEKETFELANLIGILHSDEEFRGDYNARLDELLAEKKIVVRQPDGFLAPPPDAIDPATWMMAHVALHEQLATEGFVERAVSVLQRAGYHAWKNPVGHIAVKPNKGSVLSDNHTCISEEGMASAVPFGASPGL